MNWKGSEPVTQADTTADEIRQRLKTARRARSKYISEVVGCSLECLKEKADITRINVPKTGSTGCLFHKGRNLTHHKIS
jgi:hypothetical protein